MTDKTSAAWLNYFDRQAAIDAVYNYVGKKGQATGKTYGPALEEFLSWAGDELPSAEMINRYNDHLAQRGFKASTITTRYMVPARLYLKQFDVQYVAGRAEWPIEKYRAARDYIESIREVITMPLPDQSRKAAHSKPPRTDYQNWTLSFGDDQPSEIKITMSRDEALNLMGDIMGDISQRCIFMGWYEEMEDEIPQVVAQIIRTGEEQPFETGWISVEKAKLLHSLASQLGHWVHMDDDLKYVPYIPKA